jgi:hypothetical protein
MFFKIRCIGFSFWRSKILGFIRSTLQSHIVSRIRYLGFITWGKKGPLTTTEDLSAFKSTWSLIWIYSVNKEHGHGEDEDGKVVPMAEHVPTTSTTIENTPSSTCTTTISDQGEAAVEGEVASRWEPPPTSSSGSPVDVDSENPST